MEGDLYHEANPYIYLRIAGIYYKRTVGKGWEIISEPSLTGKWNKLHPLQLAAYKPALQEAGLYAVDKV